MDTSKILEEARSAWVSPLSAATLGVSVARSMLFPLGVNMHAPEMSTWPPVATH
jgi:hypothetical protein